MTDQYQIWCYFIFQQNKKSSRQTILDISTFFFLIIFEMKV